MTAEVDTPNANTATQDAAEPASQPVSIGAQYIKDLSFESPSAPAVFSKLQDGSPDIQINVDVSANKLKDNTYEVVLLVKAQCTAAGATAFILELSYGGIFGINAAEEHHRPLLLIECPRLLFPFVRNIIADATRDGGFPPLMLSPLDFVDMYRKGMAEDGGANSSANGE